MPDTPQQQSLVEDGLDPHTLRAAEYGGTPLPVIRQGLEYLRDRLGLSPKSFFEPGSGPAPFCKVARQVWPGIRAAGCDIREEERQWAPHNTSSPYLWWNTTFHQAPAVSVDLVATNPPFSLTVEWMERALELAQDVLFLLPDNWHCSSETASEEFEDSGLENSLAHQLIVPGRIAFYGGSKTDATTYSWFHASTRPWLVEPPTDGWVARRLTRLPSSHRKWNGHRPGCEP